MRRKSLYFYDWWIFIDCDGWRAFLQKTRTHINAYNLPIRTHTTSHWSCKPNARCHNPFALTWDSIPLPCDRLWISVFLPIPLVVACCTKANMSSILYVMRAKLIKILCAMKIIGNCIIGSDVIKRASKIKRRFYATVHRVSVMGPTYLAKQATWTTSGPCECDCLATVRLHCNFDRCRQLLITLFHCNYFYAD